MCMCTQVVELLQGSLRLESELLHSAQALDCKVEAGGDGSEAEAPGETALLALDLREQDHEERAERDEQEGWPLSGEVHLR